MSIIERVLDRMERNRPQRASVSSVARQQEDDESYLEQHADIDVAPGRGFKDKYRPNVQAKRTSRTVDINYNYLKKLGILVPKTNNIMLSEQYRRIKRQILSNAFDTGNKKIRNPNLVLITSAAPEEGKSFTSLNLAFSVTNEFNNTALFIDADLPRHSSTNRLGLSDEEGLTDYLLDESKNISDILLRTDIPNLSIITTGKKKDWTPEILASKRMSRFLDELSQRYHDRLVIIDAPPLLQDSSVGVLSRIVGQVILVVEAEKTPQHVVQEAVESIEDAQYIGLILNKSNQRDESKYNYYAHVNI